MLYAEEGNVNDQSEGNQHEHDNVANTDIHGSAEPVADFNVSNLGIDSGVEGITPAQEREDLLGVEELKIAMEAAPAPAQFLAVASVRRRLGVNSVAKLQTGRSPTLKSYRS